MNERDEQRVIEALRELTGGLTVTEQDINTAEARLKDRLEPPSPRRRLVVLAAAVAAVLAAGLVISQTIDLNDDAAPPAGTPPSPADSLRAALQADAYALPSADFTAGAHPTAQDLTGFWLLRAPYNSPMFVDGNGGWSAGTPTAPFMSGTSTLAGDTWTRRLGDRGACAQDAGLVGFSQPWRAALAHDGSLRAELTIDDTTCTPAEGREVWDRVGPGSPVADYLRHGARRRLAGGCRPVQLGRSVPGARDRSPTRGHKGRQLPLLRHADRPAAARRRPGRARVHPSQGDRVMRSRRLLRQPRDRAAPRRGRVRAPPRRHPHHNNHRPLRVRHRRTGCLGERLLLRSDTLPNRSDPPASGDEAQKRSPPRHVCSDHP